MAQVVGAKGGEERDYGGDNVNGNGKDLRPHGSPAKLFEDGGREEGGAVARVDDAEIHEGSRKGCINVIIQSSWYLVSNPSQIFQSPKTRRRALLSKRSIRASTTSSRRRRRRRLRSSSLRNLEVSGQSTTKNLATHAAATVASPSMIKILSYV